MLLAICVPALSKVNPFPRIRWRIIVTEDGAPPAGWECALLRSWSHAISAIRFVTETKGSYADWKKARKNARIH